MAGRKPYTPTDEQRCTVRAMAGFGVPPDDIAPVVRCSAPTLRKAFGPELDVAAIISPKARAGWGDKQQVEVTSHGGTPVVPPTPKVLEGCTA